MFAVRKITCDHIECNKIPIYEMINKTGELINGNTSILLCDFHLTELKKIGNGEICTHRIKE
jgi:hypothetical protein